MMSIMRTAILLVLSIGLVFTVACSDDEDSGGGGTAASGASTSPGGTGGTGASGATGGTGASGATGTTTTSTPTGGAPPCDAESLEESVRITEVSIDGASSQRAITAQAGSASVVAWVAQDGVHVTPLDVVDERFGPDLVTEGTNVFGVAASVDDVALLVSRAPDYMTFVRMDLAGNVLASTDFVGGGDHNVEGTEWFGEFARTGRLVARDDGTYAAYHALHRHWPDGVGHQGDTLRLIDGQANELGGGWGWGCSHSMDERLAFGPTGLVPICISDCYPGKGIYFNHNDQQITDDPAANCGGGYSTMLGGLVAVADGFWLVYQDAQGGAHLSHHGAQGQLIDERSLAVAGSSRLALYDAGMLLGVTGGGGSSIQLLDAAGQDTGQSAAVSAPLPDQDFESRDDGEVAWASAAGTTLTVVRVRICE